MSLSKLFVVNLSVDTLSSVPARPGTWSRSTSRTRSFVGFSRLLNQVTGGESQCLDVDGIGHEGVAMAADLDEMGTTEARTVRAVYRRAGDQLVEVGLDQLSVEEVAAGQPVREFRWYRGRKHYSGWYHAASTGRLVAYESRLELARILLADFDPGVVKIAAQPFQLIGPDGDRLRHHVPDLFLVHADGLVTVVDVKAPSRMKDSKVIAQFDWTRQLCSRRGWVYETWSGAEPTVVENVRFLAGYRRRRLLEVSLVPQVLETARCQSTIGGIEAALAAKYPTEAVLPVVLHLLWSGDLLAELRAPLSRATSIRAAA
ncbi:TnsA-like heteromeric transposase endonuclease subunit [Streptomyces sp. HG99]|nr:TnsA-like heteromeric transposase endonuclease subunit [Streptomyces sp. HG99]